MEIELKDELKMSEIRSRIMGKVTFYNNEFKIRDFTLDLDKIYILTCFGSNIQIKVDDTGLIHKILVLGDDLESDREYLLINPKY